MEVTVKATSAEALRDEFVADLKRRHERLATRAITALTQRDKAKLEFAANEFRWAAEFWEKVKFEPLLEPQDADEVLEIVADMIMAAPDEAIERMAASQGVDVEALTKRVQTMIGAIKRSTRKDVH